MTDVLTYPEMATELRRLSRPVDFEAHVYVDFCGDLVRYLEATDRVAAIAAPQVGVPLRVFAWKSMRQPGRINLAINPRHEIVQGARLVTTREGCLSFPGVRVRVRRPSQVRVWWNDLEGHSRGPVVLSGFEACMWQHETDHLDGVLMIDRQKTREKEKV